jgi:hypothetical protein
LPEQLQCRCPRLISGARLNCIVHLLGLIPYEKLPRKIVLLPERSTRDAYNDRATLEGRRFVKPRY